MIRPLRLARRTGQAFGSTFVETFSQIAHAVSSPAGAAKRYLYGVTVNFRGTLTAGEGHTDITAPQLYDMLIAALTFTRYGGGLVPSPLSGREIMGSNIVQGLWSPDKDFLITGAVTDTAIIDVTFILPYAPRFFSSSGVPRKRFNDGLDPLSLYGAEGVINCTLGALPANWTCSAGLTVELSLWVEETKDIYLPQNRQMKRRMDASDPVEIPTGYSKLDYLAVLPNLFSQSLGCADNDTVPISLTCDELPVIANLSCHEINRVFGAIRDDGDRVAGVAVAGYGQEIWDPFLSERAVQQPAGSKWILAGIGAQETYVPIYIYYTIGEESADVVARALSGNGVDPGSISANRVSVNSNSLDGLALTQGEQVGMPLRVDQSRFE